MRSKPASYRDAGMTSELDRARDREAAAREILELISRSRADDAPVFDAILRRAIELCGAHAAALVMGKEGDAHQRMVASAGVDLNTITLYDSGQVPMDPEISFAAKAILTCKAVHVEDMMDTERYRRGDGLVFSTGRDSDIRTIVYVPLVTATGGIGALNIFRREVRPYTADEIALVENFAAQAVIAIENARQFRELETRLAREEATREILEVISQSRDDDRPVFDAILRRAGDLCDTPAASFTIARAGDTHQRLAAHYGFDPATVAMYDRGEVRMDPEVSFAARAILTGEVVHLEDMMDTDNYRRGVELTVSAVQNSGIRTIMFVPLVTPTGCIGSFDLFRREVRPFSADEIALMQSFAAQAVIAIENVRQFRELQTRLAREAATGEILGVISQSRSDEQPVFDTIVRNAQVLCRAPQAALILARPDEEVQRLVAHCNLSDQTVELFHSGRMPMNGNLSYAARSIIEGRIFNLPDMRESELYRSGSPVVRTMVDHVGIRSVLFLPLMDGDHAIGTFALFRYEVAPFEDQHVELVRTFAAQAVIAIQSVRQFRELQNRLEREAATRDILEVISRSRDDDRPVFALIAQSAALLCGAAVCTFWRIQDGHVHYCASYGFDRETELDLQATPSIPLQGNSLAGQVARTRIVTRIEDATANSYFDHEWARAQGVRQLIGVPILVGGEVWGSINLMWQEGRAPREADIELVQSFADQASIAIENVRQFRELQTRLAREAATREILEVISQSRDDERPVFDAVLRNSAILCGTSMASLDIISEDRSHAVLVAHWGENIAELLPVGTTVWWLDSEHAPSTCMREGRIVHVHDMADTDLYRSGDPKRVAAVDMEGIRTFLAVPLVSGGKPIGCIEVFRREVRPFTSDEIALLETFAAQAVIAIENVHQFKALEALNAELGDRVQDQVGEIERMGRLKRFLPAAVADAVVSSGSERMLKSHRALLGVLFCDIRGFTAFCETAEPEETIDVLQTYHDEMGRLIEAHGAGVDHRMGDGIMVLFNDPIPCDDPAGAAVRLGVAMRTQMAELCARWKKMGHRLGFGVGISLGYATVGMVGSGGRFDYTASGTAVNLAARLCEEALDGEILLSQRAATAVEDTWAVEARGERTLKGIREAVAVYSVAGPVP